MPVAWTGAGLLITTVELRASGARTEGAASRLGAGKLTLGAASCGGFNLVAALGSMLVRDEEAGFCFFVIEASHLAASTDCIAKLTD